MIDRHRLSSLQSTSASEIRSQLARSPLPVRRPAASVVALRRPHRLLRAKKALQHLIPLLLPSIYTDNQLLHLLRLDPPPLPTSHRYTRPRKVP